MQWGYDDWLWGKVYPEISRAQLDVIRYYWRVFYEDPQKYKGSTLEKIVFEWLEGDGKSIVQTYEDSYRF